MHRIASRDNLVYCATVTNPSKEAHQIEPPSPIQVLGVNLSIFINRPVAYRMIKQIAMFTFKLKVQSSRLIIYAPILCIVNDMKY